MPAFDVDLFYARGDSNSAKNPSLTVEPLATQPVVPLTFVESDGTTAVRLDFELGEVDPDTRVLIGDDPEPKDVTFEFSGTLPFLTRLENVTGFDLQGLRVATVTIEGERYFFLFGTDLTEAEMIEVMAALPGGAIPLDLDPPGDVAICFAADVPIDTPLGPVPAGRITVGTTLTTDRGPMLVRWVGRRRLSAAELILRPRLQPIEIPAHAIARGCPSRPLRVSPAHRIRVSGWRVELLCGTDEALCPARALAEAGIARAVCPAEGVTYVHVLLDSHRLVTSAGLASETLRPGPLADEAVGAAEAAELRALFGQCPGGVARSDLPATLRRFEAAAIFART